MTDVHQLIMDDLCKGESHRFSYAIRHNDVLKLRKVIEFASSCILICFSYIYLIIDGKMLFMNKESSKNFTKLIKD